MISLIRLSLATSFRSLLCVLTVATSVDENAFAQRGATDGQWKHYGGDAGSIKYSNLDQINRKNFNDVQELGRFVLVQGGNTCAGGIITGAN